MSPTVSPSLWQNALRPWTPLSGRFWPPKLSQAGDGHKREGLGDITKKGWEGGFTGPDCIVSHSSALREDRLLLVQTGSSSPCLDLR